METIQELRAGLPELKLIMDTRFYAYYVEEIEKFATPSKIKHRGVITIWLQRWASNHQDLINTLPGTLLIIAIILTMIITELKY